MNNLKVTNKSGLLIILGCIISFSSCASIDKMIGINPSKKSRTYILPNESKFKSREVHKNPYDTSVKPEYSPKEKSEEYPRDPAKCNYPFCK